MKPLIEPVNQKKEKQKPHFYGHRGRLRKRFIEKGLGSFADYEVIEMLLTYVIPRQDTKRLAKRLLEQFGSIAELLDTNTDTLQEKGKISETTAILIKFVRALITRYFESALSKKIMLDEVDKIIPYLQSFFRGRKKEIFKVFYLNKKNEILLHEDFGKGTETEAIAFPRRVVESSLKHNAVSVILSHNHPGGVLEPSQQDIRLTRDIQHALQTVDISLQDHIIIADDGYYSFNKNGLLEPEICNE